MKIKNFLSGVFATSLVALSLVGCSDYDNGYTEQQLSFIQGFKDTFGEIDPTQDWNLAERGTVTVTTSKPSRVKIYAKTFGKYKLVGDYEDVSGTQTLGFDVVEGTTDIMVTDGYTAQHTTSGGSAAFNSTRLILTENDNDNVDIGKTDDYKEMTEDIYAAWVEHLPETNFNLSKVSEDFVYVSTGEFTIYPIYWNTSNLNELGVYYLDSNGAPKYVPIYKIKALRDNDTWTVEEVKNADGKLESKVTHQDNNSYGNYERSGTGEIQVLRERFTWEGYPTDGYDWADAKNMDTPYDIGIDDNGKYVPLSGPEKIRAKGITVNIKPVGTVFGMYIKTKDGYLFHSNKARNTDAGVSYDIDNDGNAYNITKNQSSIKAPHAGTFIDKGRLYLGFEDWSGDNDSDFDLNDCVFMFGDDIPEVLDDGSDRWIISAEDLGNTYDIDYNDVVIEVSHVSGTRRAYVTPMAAGGTLASYVYFGDTPVGGDIIDSNGNNKTGEIHELFSSQYAKTTSGEYSPLNVNSSYTPSRRTYEISVPRSFSLASNIPDRDPETTTEPEDHNMGGFQVWVLQQGVPIPEKGLTEDMINNLKAEGKIQQIRNAKTTFQISENGTMQTEDNVPYVICTPKYWKRDGIVGHYRWPKERVPMCPYNEFTGTAAYNETGSPTFAQWVADKNVAQDWYMYPNVDQTIAPSGIGVDPEGDIFGGGNSGGGNTGGDTGEEGGDTPGGNQPDYSEYGTPITIGDGQVNGYYGYLISIDQFSTDLKDKTVVLTIVYSSYTPNNNNPLCIVDTANQWGDKLFPTHDEEKSILQFEFIPSNYSGVLISGNYGDLTIKESRIKVKDK